MWIWIPLNFTPLRHDFLIIVETIHFKSSQIDREGNQVADCIAKILSCLSIPLVDLVGDGGENGNGVPVLDETDDRQIAPGTFIMVSSTANADCHNNQLHRFPRTDFPSSHSCRCGLAKRSEKLVVRDETRGMIWRVSVKTSPFFNRLENFPRTYDNEILI
ncbi:hypothetical protein QYF36_023027 [Acer negundo]|nr:hypothetical protein QYF36_023027 [Acer negundo]